jgi:arsenate reductase-like glutaredoxin family protein
VAEWRDYDKSPLDKKELESLIGGRPVEDFLNPRSTPYRELGLKGKKISKAKAIDLMLEDMNLLKRPLVVKGARYIFGYSEDEYRTL